jgi:hypothetical protein
VSDGLAEGEALVDRAGVGVADAAESAFGEAVPQAASALAAAIAADRHRRRISERSIAPDERRVVTEKSPAFRRGSPCVG